ncbi:hypothetical protein HZC09_03870 [Candidatus Micrarchaeota archaeon]|nr:hypothetical protein [Candidatus Micrarchaeota archaeon]
MINFAKAASSFARAFRADDFHAMKKISADAARDAFVEQDQALLDLSLVSYSVMKLSQKPYIISTSEWKEFRREMLDSLSVVRDRRSARKVFHRILLGVNALGEKFGRFARDSVEKAKLRAAAQMYAHGASLLSATEFSGASLQEVASYIGATKIPEKYETMPVAERMGKALEVFG